ncbi:MAG: SGNH/GDSL hydrolase family protein [Eubacteriales bacterium]
MKIIAMVGDSHTWGQGVGADYGLYPRLQGGDLRMLPFSFPSYVNLIRDYFSLTTHSTANDYCRDKLTALFEKKDGQVGFCEGEFEIEEEFDLCRVFFKADSVERNVEICADGETVKSVSLRYVDERGDDEDAGEYNKCIKLVNVFPTFGTAKKLKIKGSAFIERLEFYRGEYAVVNCGVGSCCVEKYLAEYFDSYVVQLHPYAAVFEGCTINDWITTEGPEQYGKNILKAIEELRKLTPRVLLHTVFPIAGGQTIGGCDMPYAVYVNAMIQAAKSVDVPIADCYAGMSELLKDAPDTLKNAFMYHDNWHPNGTGHYFYARQILPELKKIIVE